MRIQKIKDKITTFNLGTYETVMLVFARGDLFSVHGWIYLDSMSRSCRGTKIRIILPDLKVIEYPARKFNIPKERFVILKNVDTAKAEMSVNINE